nr:hypothetical protein [Megavirus caiporensis]
MIIILINKKLKLLIIDKFNNNNDNINKTNIIIMSKYEWSTESAFNKLKSDLSVSINMPFISISKQITPSCDRERDAYRNCAKCGRHFNYHRSGFCPL